MAYSYYFLDTCYETLGLIHSFVNKAVVSWLLSGSEHYCGFWEVTQKAEVLSVNLVPSSCGEKPGMVLQVHGPALRMQRQADSLGLPSQGARPKHINPQVTGRDPTSKS